MFFKGNSSPTQNLKLHKTQRQRPIVPVQSPSHIGPSRLICPMGLSPSPKTSNTEPERHVTCILSTKPRKFRHGSQSGFSRISQRDVTCHLGCIQTTPGAPNTTPGASRPPRVHPDHPGCIQATPGASRPPRVPRHHPGCPKHHPGCPKHHPGCPDTTPGAPTPPRVPVPNPSSSAAGQICPSDPSDPVLCTVQRSGVN